MSPQKQLLLIQQKKSKLWYENFTDLFSFYAQFANIPTRLVCLEGKANNNVYFAGHSFNEVYIKEMKKWIFVDLTSNTILVENNHHNYLNSSELKKLYQLSPESIIKTSLINDTIKKQNLTLHDDFYKSYFNSDSYLVYYKANQFPKNNYSFFQKLKRYVSTASTFLVYDTLHSHHNFKFYTKQFALVTLCLFVVYLITQFIFRRNKK